MKWIKKIITAVSILLLNVMIIFIAANVLASVFLSGPSIIKKYGFEKIRKAYAGWIQTDEEIKKLLNETWSLKYIYEPFVQFRETPQKGEYVNVTKYGFRLIKDQAAYPPNREAFNIIIFGGSTTFGRGVKDDDTIPSYLQEVIGERMNSSNIAVYNFGRGNYYSSQERILGLPQN